MRDLFLSLVKKLLLTLFVLQLARVILCEILRRVTQTEVVIAIVIISSLAYLVRKRRGDSTRKPRSTSTGERTPVMPRSNR